MRRTLIVLSACVLTLMLTLSGVAAKPFPKTLPLPDGFQPEGIEIGPGTTFYVGSIPTGAIYRGDLRTGEVDATPGCHVQICVNAPVGDVEIEL